jgi:hypothetical protein
MAALFLRPHEAQLQIPRHRLEQSRDGQAVQPRCSKAVETEEQGEEEEVKLDALEHPKTYELMSALKLKRPHAIGHLELLWAFVGKNAPQGNIGKWSNGAIARACEWEGDPDEFVDALVSSRLLDEDEENRLLVHDWAEHAPGWVRAKVKDKGGFITPICRAPSSPGGSPPGSAPSSPGGTGPSILGKRIEGKGREAYDAREPEDETEHAEWEATAALYPPGAARVDWIAAEKAARQIVERGEASWKDLRAGVKRYAALCLATNRLVTNPLKFFTDADKPWSQAWPIPLASATKRMKSATEIAEEYETRATQ